MSSLVLSRNQYARDFTYSWCPDWVGVAWQRPCKTRLTLGELDTQGTVSGFAFSGHHEWRSRCSISCGIESLQPRTRGTVSHNLNGQAPTRQLLVIARRRWLTPTLSFELRRKIGRGFTAPAAREELRFGCRLHFFLRLFFT